MSDLKELEVLLNNLTLEQLKKEHLLQFPDICYSDIINFLKYKNSEFASKLETEFLDAKKTELYIKYLNSLPAEDYLKGLVERHLTPLELEKGGFSVEFGNIGFSGTMLTLHCSENDCLSKSSQEDIPKIYVPMQYMMGVKLTKEDKSITEEIYLEIKDLKRFDAHFDIKWQARSYIKDREWVEKKINRDNTCFIILQIKDIESAKRIHEDIFKKYSEIKTAKVLSKKDTDKMNEAIIFQETHDGKKIIIGEGLPYLEKDSSLVYEEEHKWRTTE